MAVTVSHNFGVDEYLRPLVRFVAYSSNRIYII